MKKMLMGILIVMNTVVLCLVGVLIYILLNKSNTANVASEPTAETISTSSSNEIVEDSAVLFEDVKTNTTEDVEACFERLKAEYQEKIDRLDRETELALMTALLEEGVKTNDARYHDIKIEGIDRKLALTEEYEGMSDTCMP